jgi:hypothetical protein
MIIPLVELKTLTSGRKPQEDLSIALKIKNSFLAILPPSIFGNMYDYIW